MRKSLAPSQRLSIGEKNQSLENKNENSNNNFITIERMPLFGFLSIPNNLKSQFKVPTGCKITSKSIELRKVKSLGVKRNWQPLRPGELSSFRTTLSENNQPYGEEEDEDLEGLPNIESLPPFERLILWRDDQDESHKIEVIPELASKLRPHQREGVQFLFECTMGLRGFVGEGCILADDMGLGKTLMSITTMWTLLNQGFVKGASAVRKVVIACPTSLVGNWENEINRWLNGKCIIFAVKSEPKKIIKNFVQHTGKGVLIVSYETQRRYSDMFMPSKLHTQSSCDLLICDEAHKLKNAESGLAISLNKLPAKKRILLSGTPMQNELTEFYNMVNFCNPLVIGTSSEFKKKYERPILRAREPDASRGDKDKASSLQRELSTIVNEFILKRGNILNAQHLPPKLVQFVCCKLTPLQEELYDTLLGSKAIRHIRDGIQKNPLNSIRHMMNICCHPQMILDAHRTKSANDQECDEELQDLVDIIHKSGGLESRPKASSSSSSSSSSNISYGMMNRRGSLIGQSSNRDLPVDYEQSGKLTVLVRLMQTLRAMKEGDRIVIVSNYTNTLDIIENLCKEYKWPVLRLDGSTGANKRTKLVSDFNNPGSGAFVFLLSSKAGGCGINLIGGNRLVLFDPDWNPASDKQAAGRIWREGQKKRCYIYRFMSTSTIEEKIIQRQLSKESLQSIVDDKEAVNQLSQYELKNLFIRRQDTRSDTHDTLRCKRCNSVKVLSLPNSKKLSESQIEECQEFLRDLIAYVKEAISVTTGIEIDDLITCCEDLSKNLFDTLPNFSKKLRGIITSIQQELDSKDCKVALYDEFLNRWADLIPMLSVAATATSNHPETSGKRSEEDEDDFENVPQIGCPDEEDFNKWSHHCSVNTCDDEALRRAVSDSEAVSFLFGLEVNWDLLQEKQLATRDVDEQRKEELRLQLEDLNRRRSLEKESSNRHNEMELDIVNASESNNKSRKSVSEDCKPTKKVKTDVIENKRIRKEKKRTVILDDSDEDNDDEDHFCDSADDLDDIDLDRPDDKMESKCDNITDDVVQNDKSRKSLDSNENTLDNDSFQDKSFVKTITSKPEKTAVSNKENKSSNIKTSSVKTETSKSLSLSSSSSSSSSSQNSSKNFNLNTPWVCPRCTFESAEGTRRCDMCNFKRLKPS